MSSFRNAANRVCNHSTDTDFGKRKKTLILERLSIWELRLVRQLDYRWNRFCSSLDLMHEKLAALGVGLVNAEADYLDP
jgi:hypothetical protein